MKSMTLKYRCLFLLFFFSGMYGNPQLSIKDSDTRITILDK